MDVKESTSVSGYTYRAGGDISPEWVWGRAARLARDKAHAGLHIQQALASSPDPARGLQVHDHHGGQGAHAPHRFANSRASVRARRQSITTARGANPSAWPTRARGTEAHGAYARAPCGRYSGNAGRSAVDTGRALHEQPGRSQAGSAWRSARSSR